LVLTQAIGEPHRSFTPKLKRKLTFVRDISQSDFGLLRRIVFHSDLRYRLPKKSKGSMSTKDIDPAMGMSQILMATNSCPQI
jgi:hypothetical protein